MPTPPLAEARRSSRPLWWVTGLTLLALVAALSGLFYLIYRDWLNEKRDGLIQEMLWLEQSFRLQMQSHREWGEVTATEILAGALNETQFRRNARQYMQDNPELVELQRIAPDGNIRWDGRRQVAGQTKLQGEQQEAHWRVSRLLRPLYSQPYPSAEGKTRVDLLVPLVSDGGYQGSIRLVYQLERQLQQQVPWWIASKYDISVVDVNGRVLARKFDQPSAPRGMSYQINFDPPGYGLLLRAVAYRVGLGVTLPALTGSIILLTLLLGWAMWRIRRHVRERSVSESALAAEVAWRQAIEDCMKGGLLTLAEDGRIERVNQAFCELTGFPPETLIGARPPYPFWPPEQRDLHEAALHDLMQGEHLEHGVELPFLSADGRRIDVRFYVAPLVGQGMQERRGWIATLYDITELKRQRLELKATHERFLAVLNGLHAGVCVTSCDNGVLLYANPAFEELWQVPHDEAVYCPTLPRLPEARTLELEFSPDGGRRWFQLDRRIISWVDGNEVWLDILADVTASRERDARERAQEERFQTTSRLIAMGEMASSLAHELNQPLTAIRTYSSGLIRRLPPETERDPTISSAVQAIAEQAKRAGQIIASIRAFIKKHEPQLELFEAGRVVNRAIRLAEPLAQKQGVRIKVEADPHPCELQIDPVLIEQVLLNLLKNAVEALVTAQTVQPSIQLRTHKGGAYWRVEVADNGPGLSATMQANLFTPFYSTKPEGMGIGLNICRSIIEFHRGEFGANTSLSGGCIFWFTLPLHRVEESKTAPEGAA